MECWEEGEDGSSGVGHLLEVDAEGGLSCTHSPQSAISTPLSSDE